MFQFLHGHIQGPGASELPQRETLQRRARKKSCLWGDQKWWELLLIQQICLHWFSTSSKKQHRALVGRLALWRCLPQLQTCFLGHAEMCHWETTRALQGCRAWAQYLRQAEPSQVCRELTHLLLKAGVAPVLLTRVAKKHYAGCMPPSSPRQSREKTYRRDLPCIGKFRDHPHVPLPPSFLLLNSSTGFSIVRGLDFSPQFYPMHNLGHASFLYKIFILLEAPKAKEVWPPGCPESAWNCSDSTNHTPVISWEPVCKHMTNHRILHLGQAILTLVC